ncbi:MAG: TetR/AcrR family transcriptional regulator [Burkholderiaceae bacterium]
MPKSTDQKTLPPTRDRLIAAMLDALRTRGFHGVGLNDLLKTSGTPKGVLYHHFPGGKTELAVAAINLAVEHLHSGLNKVFERENDPGKALNVWMDSAQKLLAHSDFEKGCPLATIALESTAKDLAIRDAIAHGFSSLRMGLADQLMAARIDEARARSLAALIVSAYEGALLQARVAGNVSVMQETTEALQQMIQVSMAKQRHSRGTQ